uniref:Uncharacterized protein n=1 Tax=Panagrolaimus sp. JU765 TaxID=591449 RepID=A0AC34QJV9_9BILA
MFGFWLITVFCLLQNCNGQFEETPEDFRAIAAYCPYRPPPGYADIYLDRFQETVSVKNMTEFTCNTEIAKMYEMKIIKASAKNFSESEPCGFWIPGGTQVQFIHASVTNPDASVVVREGCKFPQLHFRSAAITDFRMKESPVIQRNFGHLELVNFTENDYVLFRFKRAYPLDQMKKYTFLRKVKQEFNTSKTPEFHIFEHDNPEISRSF